MNTLHEWAPGLMIQGLKPPLRLRDFKLIAFDMDSTQSGLAPRREAPRSASRA